MIEPAWFEASEGERLSCGLCHHACQLNRGSFGLCRVRGNREGRPFLPAHSLLSSIALDPIEKKPLYRFLPGTRTFSVGFFGCNLRCPFCQNWEISQVARGQGQAVDPGRLAELAFESGAPSLAFTYSEPSIHFEYLIEAAKAAHARGLATVLVTNGSLKAGPAAALLAHMDAVNLDIKCLSAEAYRRRLAGDLETVLNFARLASESCWLEATTLVVPGLDEWEPAVEGISRFLASLSPAIPLHLSAYHPAWQLNEAPSPPALLQALAVRARAQLAHVYTGNISGEASEDACPACGTPLIRRRGYDVRVSDLVPEAAETAGRPRWTKNSRCARCGRSLRLATAIA